MAAVTMGFASIRPFASIITGKRTTGVPFWAETSTRAWTGRAAEGRDGDLHRAEIVQRYDPFAFTDGRTFGELCPKRKPLHHRRVERCHRSRLGLALCHRDKRLQPCVADIREPRGNRFQRQRGVLYGLCRKTNTGSGCCATVCHGNHVLAGDRLSGRRRGRCHRQRVQVAGSGRGAWFRGLQAPPPLMQEAPVARALSGYY